MTIVQGCLSVLPRRELALPRALPARSTPTQTLFLPRDVWRLHPRRLQRTRPRPEARLDCGGLRLRKIAAPRIPLLARSPQRFALLAQQRQAILPRIRHSALPFHKKTPRSLRFRSAQRLFLTQTRGKHSFLPAGQTAALFRAKSVPHMHAANPYCASRRVFRLTGEPDYGNGCCDGIAPNFPLIRQTGAETRRSSIFSNQPRTAPPTGKTVSRFSGIIIQCPPPRVNTPFFAPLA